MINALITLFGGIAIFLYGLKNISSGTESLITNTKTNALSALEGRPIAGALLGMAVAGVTQSSVAISFITVSLVEVGALSFAASAPIIIGANVGTTVTAQLVSLSGGGGSAIGAISSIIGLLTAFCKKDWVKRIGEVAFGLGFVFAGLSIMDTSIHSLVGYGWFKSLFLLSSPIVLFLNGLILTAVVQSSSAVTGITVLLASSGLVDFKTAVFLTLGSNVGSCFSVIVASLNKSLQARRASLFNLLFNLLGAVIFFPILLIFGNVAESLFLAFSTSLGRAIANFHTVFNLVCALLFMPFCGKLTSLIAKVVTDKRPVMKNREDNKTFTSKSRRFY